MKYNEDFTNKDICEYIFNDYINDMELDETEKTIRNLPLLIDNNLACKITGTDCTWVAESNKYRIACKFMQKYNKRLKNNRREPDKYDFGGSENMFAKTDSRLVDLARYALEQGKYFTQLDKSTYAILCSESESDDGYNTIKYDFYIVGSKWKKWKNKFMKMVKEYEAISDKQDNDRIFYTNGQPSSSSIFKSFDQVIFKDKDKILKYIDNWVNNIPTYYEDYAMVSKLSIMLYGDPGTGKSTFCKALAKYLDISTITSVSSDYFESNDNKRGTSHYLPTVYALDDVDCICNSREDDKSKENLTTVSNLLSFLDNPPTFYFKAKNGVKYPVSIIVATTNYYDKLDAAVKRYGRFDLKIEMKNFNREQAQEMCDIYKIKLENIVKDTEKKGFRISPSYLQALCLENIDRSMKAIN